MALNFPLNPELQTPINTYGPTSTPEANTSNNLTYYFDGVKWGTVTTPLPFVSKSGDTMTGPLVVPNIETTTLNGGQLAGLRNKIINGGMSIFQRGTGQFINNASGGLYVVDRWQSAVNNATLSLAYNSSLENYWGIGPVDSPEYIRLTTSVASSSPVVGDIAYIAQPVEAYNIRDFMWGSVDAKPVTLSFRVRASRAGTYSGSLRTNSGTVNYRSCAFTYTITTANTWQDFSITLPGDPSMPRFAIGAEDGAGVHIYFDVGSGNTFRTPTTGAWVPGNFVGVQGTENMGPYLNATWDLTNVQLEVGSIATPFERRPVSMELILCQRYFQWVPFNALNFFSSPGWSYQVSVPFIVQMRASPTVGSLVPDPNTAQNSLNNTANNFVAVTPYSCSANFQCTNAGAAYVIGYRAPASIEL
jgi:hypothetical protein